MTVYHIKKVIGTSFLVSAVFALILLFSGQARSLLTFIGNDLTFTGIVTQVNPNSFQVEKGGTYPFTIVTDGSTAYTGGYADISDISIGNQVYVEAREHQGMLLAEEISPSSASGYGYGYGGGCELFEGSELWVSAIESDFLWLSRANITFTVQYDANTIVLPGSQSVQDLVVGETIAIVGEDCHEEGIYADTIIRDGVPPTDITACDDLGGHIIGNSQVLLSHDAGGAFTIPQSVSVPAGVYDVYGVSFDDHTVQTWDTLTNERWFAEGSYDGSLVYTSGTTDDLPDGIDSNITMIGDAVFVPELDEIRFVHAAYVDPTYQSIFPDCIAFVPVEPIDFGLLDDEQQEQEDETEQIVEVVPAEDETEDETEEAVELEDLPIIE